MNHITAESTQDLFEYMSRKIDRGTTWEQLANKLDARGILLNHHKVEFLWWKLYDNTIRCEVDEDIRNEFSTYVRAIDAAFLSDDDIYTKLMAKLDYLAAAPREHCDIKEQIDLLRSTVTQVFKEQE